MDTTLFSMSVRLFAQISAMNAENEQRKHLGQSMAYTDADYHYEINEFDRQLNKYYKDYEKLFQKTK